MIEISLYQPGRVDAAIPFPSAWNELLPEELRHVCAMFLSSFENPTAIRAAILTGLLKIRSALHKVKLPRRFEDILSAEDAVLNGYPAIDFLFTQNNLTTQPFPVIKFPLSFRSLPSRLHGPASGFNNLTCGEYEDCEIFFFKFKEKPEPTALAHIAAILWRPQNTPYITYTNGKKNEYKASAMVNKMMSLPAWQLYAIYCWYSGCRAQLLQLFPTTFSGGGTGKPDILSFTKCIHAGAGPKNGTRENIRLMPLKEFLFDIEQEAIKAEQLKLQMNKK